MILITGEVLGEVSPGSKKDERNARSLVFLFVEGCVHCATLIFEAVYATITLGNEADSPPAEPRRHGQNERIVRARVKVFGGTA